MADNSYDCVDSDLPCTETIRALCFDDLDSVATDRQTHQSDGGEGLIFGNGGSDPLIDFPILSEESFCLMVGRESQYMPADDYLSRLRTGELDLTFRREALDWIWKAHSHFGFGEFSFCLSMNYLDRFLSMYELPRGKTWAVQLLAVACLSLAAKLEEISVPLTVDLQVGDPKFLFDGKTIQKMELLVLSTLKWRMQADTPCSFIDYFLRKINGDQLPSLHVISRSMHLILSTIKGIDFLEFRPSEVAAAVAIFVSGKTQAIDIIKAMPSFAQETQKERLAKCVELIQNLKLKRNAGGSGSSIPQSPNGVLEAACLSDEQTAGSCPSSSTSTPDTKRRKLETQHNK
nr:cyclin-D4-1-like [Ipomoea trifida]